MVFRDVFPRGSKILVVGLGGGGDVVSTAMLALALRREGYQALIGSVVWERYVNDPVPGPVSLSEIQGIKMRGEHYGVVTGECTAMRGGRIVRFQAANVAEALDEKVFVFDLYGGEESLAKGFLEAVDNEGFTAVMGVDVGGDILARGCEEGLWSPLADSIGLSALSRDELASRAQCILAVHSIGADGELDPGYVLGRIMLVAREQGYFGARGITRNDVEVLKKILEHASSEASSVQIRAFEGTARREEIRSGSRMIDVTLLQTITFLLDPAAAYRLCQAARLVRGTRSINEARRKLNANGVYTELDLEIDVQAFIEKHGRLPEARELLDIKWMGRKRLGLCRL